MANNQTLLSYLMVAPPGIPTENTNETPNTTNSHYSYRDITDRYGNVLQQTQIESEPMPNSPVLAIKTEPMFAIRFNKYIHNRLRRALRAGFQRVAPQLPNLDLTPMTVDIGDAATIIDNFRPDIAFFQTGSPLGSSPNRCPGDLKVSWKWGSGWETASNEAKQREFYQVLSQINYYMKQNNARYGFVLTDTELVPIKRLDGNGRLQLAQPIQWETKGPERLTILLGLWYLGMLGAANNDWRLL
ncbi:hypothetical protein ACJ73_07644 [Blastomyces percursus]|uniref:Fungal-type protein kinase domain-containing protein n=1 Tax=Blastomyces percursus TaxID=1658174 RepID=A0A1J9QXV1_9EURO|nr:hypothetical protein ACJ73_07644 [Blastomyces percursus]